MKKRYQIDQQRAVQQFRRLATEQNPNIQMILPMADIVGLLQEGVGNLLRHAGLELMHLVMDEEVKSLAGERHQQHEQRRAHRWGTEDGYCVVDGQKVPIKRTRLRSGDHREQRLGSYELFQRDGPLQQGVWDKMMRGLSTRNYGAVVKDFQSAYGIEKSAVSENFIEASREKVKQLMERPLGQLQLCAVLIDGTPFKDRQIIAALGIGCDGRKTVLGIREGATENTAVVSSLLSELVERGLDFSTPRLYILDGGKPYTRRCGATRARLPSSSAARSTRSAMSWITCRTNTRRMSGENCRTPTRWRTTPMPNVLWNACIAN
jgi:putative transposase